MADDSTPTPTTVRLFNPLTQNSGDVPLDKVKSSIDMGAQLAQPAVRMYNPESKKEGDVPAEKVHAALQMGANIVGSTDHKIATTDYGTSLLRGAIQGATFGFGDELAGSVKGLYDTATKGGNLSDNYKAARDTIRAQDDIAQQANPKTFVAGQVGGALIPTLASGGAAGELGLAGRLGLGAAEGAVNGLGASNANTVGGNLQDAAVGGALGGAGTGLGEAAGAIGSKLFGGATKALDPEKNLALALGANAKDLDPIRGKQFLAAVKHLSDEDYFPKTATTEGLFQKVLDDKEASGEAIGTIYQNAEKEAPLVSPTIHRPLVAELPEGGLELKNLRASSPDGKTIGLQDKLDKIMYDAPAGERAGLDRDVQDFAQKIKENQSSVLGLWDVRKVIDNQISLKGGWNQHLNPAAVEIRQSFRDALKNHLNDVVADLARSKPDNYSPLARLNKLYGSLETVDDSLARKFGREGANATPLGLKYRSALAGVLGAGVIGHPAVGLPLAMAQQAMSGTEGQLGAAAVGKFMPAIGAAADSVGPAVHAAVHAGINAGIQHAVPAAPPPPPPPPPSPPPPPDPSTAIRAKLQQLPLPQRAKALSAYNATGAVPPGLMGPPPTPAAPPNFSQFAAGFRRAGAQ